MYRIVSSASSFLIPSFPPSFPQEHSTHFFPFSQSTGISLSLSIQSKADINSVLTYLSIPALPLHSTSLHSTPRHSTPHGWYGPYLSIYPHSILMPGGEPKTKKPCQNYLLNCTYPPTHPFQTKNQKSKNPASNIYISRSSDKIKQKLQGIYIAIARNEME